MLAAVCLAPACVDDPRPDHEAELERLDKFILSAPPKTLAHELDVAFEDKVQLLGYSIEPEQGQRPGTTVKLTMYWKLLKDLEPGWSLFTHLLDASGQRLLTLDNVGPLRAWRGTGQALPPGEWEVGRVYADEQTFTVPAGANGAILQIVTGVFKGEERLQIVKGAHDREHRAQVATLNLVERKKRSTAKKPRKANKVPQLRVTRLDEDQKITIDGVLNEPAWMHAISTRPFVNVKTGKRDKKIPISARVKLLLDDTHMYVGFDVQDPDLNANFDKKAKDPYLWTDDAVEILIDPDGDGDNKDYYEIQINPQNLVFDSHFDRYNLPRGDAKEGPFGHQEWSAELQSAVTIRGTLNQPGDKDIGYVVEAAIPWKSFHRAKQVPPKPGDTWRMNFYAVEKDQSVAWSPILSEGNFHKASRFGKVIWSDRAVPRLDQRALDERSRRWPGMPRGLPVPRTLATGAQQHPTGRPPPRPPGPHAPTHWGPDER